MLFVTGSFRTRLAGWVVLGLLVLGTAQAMAATPGFLPNDGRLDDAVLFYASSPRLDIFFTHDGVMFDIKDPASVTAMQEYSRSDVRSEPLPERRGHALRLGFAAAAPAARPEAMDPGTIPMNFFFGEDSRNWRTGVRGFQTLLYRDLWPGVDLEFRMVEGRLSYRLSDESARANLIWTGAETTLDPAGLTELVTPYGALVDDGQRIGSTESPADDLVFAQRGVGALLWSTLSGGSGDDEGSTLAVASNGDIIVGGETSSPDYPGTPGAYNEDFSDYLDVFVSRFSDEGSNLVWSTFIGTSNNDYCNAIVLDANDNPIIGGRSGSSNYPTTPGAFDTTFNGGISDATVSKLSGDGQTLMWSTFVGGSEVDSFFDMAVDASGDLVCVGYTASTDYPTTAGVFQDFFAGPPYDHTISTLSADGSTLQVSSYLGGTDRDACRGIAIDDAGDLYLAGFSFSTDFPVTPGAFQITKSTMEDAALTKMSADLSTVIWSTYLGGDGSDRSLAIDLDSNGDPVIAGFTYSTDFPTSPGVLQESYGYSMESFVAKFHAADGNRDWSTYIGGLHEDEIFSVQVDAQDNPLITGWTTSTNFPVNDLGFDSTHNGGEDIFVSRLSTDGSALLWGTYLGGSGDDRALELAIDADDNPLITGHAASNDFPVSSWAYGQTPSGGDDMVLARFDTGDAAMSLSSATTSLACGLTATVTFSFTPDLPHTPPLRGYSVRVVAPEGLTFGPGSINVLSPISGVNDTFQIIENDLGDCTIDFSFLDQGAGLDVFGELFTIDFEGTGAGVSTVAIAEGIFRDADNHPFDVDILDTLDLTVDCTPPAAPLLAAEPVFTQGTENQITWTDESLGDAVEFNVQASTEGDFSVITAESGFFTGFSHTFTDLADGTTYFYRAFGRSESGLASAASAPESSTQDASPPQTAAAPLPGAVPATFDLVFSASDAGSGVESVELFYSHEGGAFTSAGLFLSSPATFTATDGDGDYAFYTVGTDSVGNVESAPGAADAASEVDTTAPDTPTLGAEPAYTPADSNTVTASDESASGAFHYRFQWSEAADFAVIGADSGPVTGPGHTFTGLVDGTTYFFRAAALDSLGNSSGWSNVVNSTQDTSAPVSSAQDPGDQSQTTFDVPFTATDAGSGVAGVQLHANFAGGVFSNAGSTTSSPISFTAAEGEGLYGFFTVAVDSLGNLEASPGSAQVFCLLDLTAPTSAVDSLDAFQANPTFTLTATAEDNLSGLALIEWFFQVDGGVWTSAGTSELPSFDFTAPQDGAFGFYCVATDSVGNSEAAPAEPDAQTLVDTTGPTGHFVINGDSPATNDTGVTLSIAVGGAAEMRFSNDDTVFPLGWVPIDTTAAWTLPAQTGTATVYGEFRDTVGNTTQLTDTILFDQDAPGVATFLETTPRHQGVDLVWHDPDDADLEYVEIWRGLRHDGSGESAYPLYQGVTVPTPPADRAAAVASSEWVLAGTAPAAAQVFSDTLDTRGIYHYELFAVDAAGNSSAPCAQLPASTNYILGDMAVPFDGVVNGADLTYLGSTYGLPAGEQDFYPDADVGPTDDLSGTGLPLPDAVINFEDLMSTTNNYGLAAKAGTGAGVEKVGGNEPVAISWLVTGPSSYTLFLEDMAGDLKGLNLQADLPAGVQAVVTAGALCAEQFAPVFLQNIPRNGVDVGLSILGPGATFQGTGALFTVTLQGSQDLELLDLGVIHLDLRNSRNGPVEFAFDQASAAEVPTVFSLDGNYPNPFNPSTTIRFSLPQQENVRLEIFGVDGRLARVLLDEPMGAGRHEIIWSGRDGSGHMAASGVYFYRIRAGGFHAVQKMTLMK